MVCLYIATHNKTGKKYFGKTERYFTEESLQKYYHGSGKKWIEHLKEYGDDVTMEIYGIFEHDEVEIHARSFSKDNNIVESDTWANIIPENGIGGGRIGGFHHTEDSKKKISAATKQYFLKYGSRQHSEETKTKIRERFQGIKLSEEHKEKLSNAKRGRTLSDTHKENIKKYQNSMSSELKEIKSKKCSEAGKKCKGTIHKTHECPHCGKIGRGGAMNRYHFNNCLQNPDLSEKEILIQKEKRSILEETKIKISKTLLGK